MSTTTKPTGRCHPCERCGVCECETGYSGVADWLDKRGQCPVCADGGWRDFGHDSVVDPGEFNDLAAERIEAWATAHGYHQDA